MAVEDLQPLEHAWQLDEREITRHVERRGRVHAFEHLNPRRTALVVVDMIPFFVAGLAHARGIVPRVNAAAAIVRTRGGTVAWVVPAPAEPSALDQEFYGNDVATVYAASGGEGSPRTRLWPELDVGPDDLVVEKSLPSAFFPGSCDLHAQLQARDIDAVLIAGTVANVCCESTARDARALGYRVVMLADATAAPTDEMLNATLRTIYRSFGDVRPAADLERLLSDT